jgi:hypothetical protein
MIPAPKSALEFLYVPGRVVGGDEMRSLKSERVKYGRESQGTRTRDTALVRTSSIHKRQTHPLFREGAPQKQDRNGQTILNFWSWAPDGARHQDLLTDWPSVVMWLWLWCQVSWTLTSTKAVTRVEAESNTSTVTLRVIGGDGKRSLKSDKVKYGRESQGTRTQERLHWQGQVACSKGRLILSSGRAPHKNKTVTVKQ